MRGGAEYVGGVVGAAGGGVKAGGAVAGGGVKAGGAVAGGGAVVGGVA